MNKAIQYREDGKFYGLVNVLEEPQRKDFELSGSYMLACNRYDSNLRSCIAAGKEIVNPWVLNRPWRPSPGDVVTDLKPGDIFPCPGNIEFEEDQFCAYHNLNCSYCGTCAGSCYKPKKVIRLKLKQEVNPVESQDATKELLLYINDIEIKTVDEPLDDDEFIELIKSKFTIQRNKNGNE